MVQYELGRISTNELSWNSVERRFYGKCWKLDDLDLRDEIENCSVLQDKDQYCFYVLVHNPDTKTSRKFYFKELTKDYDVHLRTLHVFEDHTDLTMVIES